MDLRLSSPPAPTAPQAVAPRFDLEGDRERLRESAQVWASDEEEYPVPSDWMRAGLTDLVRHLIEAFEPLAKRGLTWKLTRADDDVSEVEIDVHVFCGCEETGRPYDLMDLSAETWHLWRRAQCWGQQMQTAQRMLCDATLLSSARSAGAPHEHRGPSPSARGPQAPPA